MQKLTAIFLCLLCLNCDDRNPVKDKTIEYSAKDLAFVSDLIELNESLSYTLESQIKQDMTVVAENGESFYRITQLNLAERNISFLPGSIGNLDSLTFLDIEENLIEDIPDTVCSLTQLQETLTNGNKLCIPGNYPSCLSSGINIYLQDCESYPDENDQEFLDQLFILNGINDSVMDLINNERVVWAKIYDSLGVKNRITKLDFSSLNLDTVPSTVGYLSYLEEVELEYNNLSSIPETIGDLTNLSILNLSDNEITSLPYNIRKLINLSEFTIFSNNITRLEFSFSQLTSLTKFWIYENEIEFIDSSFCEIHPVESFYLYNNKLCENILPCLEDEVNSSSQDCGY